jgi:hypothetical protein
VWNFVPRHKGRAQTGCLRTGCWGEYLDLRGTEAGENCIMRSFVIFTVHQILLGWSNQTEWDGRGM